MFTKTLKTFYNDTFQVLPYQIQSFLPGFFIHLNLSGLTLYSIWAVGRGRIFLQDQAHKFFRPKTFLRHIIPILNLHTNLHPYSERPKYSEYCKAKPSQAAFGGSHISLSLYISSSKIQGKTSDH